jgi:hypothetical protein
MTLIMGLFFVVLGTIGMLALWFPEIRSILIVFILRNALFISIFSLALFAIGIAIVISVIQSTRHRYYKIQAGRNLATVDESLIEGYINSYWRDFFPKLTIPSRVTLKNNKIFITADLPHFPSEEQKNLIEKIDRDVSNILSKIFGYNREFSLEISFNETSKSP